MKRAALILSALLFGCAADVTVDPCAAAPDGTPCRVCDLAGVCSGGTCGQTQSGPPHCP